MEPWEIKADDNRLIDTLTTFLIFCEDEVSEPIYFRHFERENSMIKVNTIPNKRSGKLNLTATIDYCSDKGLIIFQNFQYCLAPNITDKIWCVYDRDLETDNVSNIVKQDDINFTTAIISAEQSGICVAWSNDAFELWILLHFEQVPTGQRLHRNYIYERLTSILKVITSQSAEMKTLTSNPFFNYKDFMKRKQNFLLCLLPLLEQRREIALVNAAALEAYYNHSMPYHEWNPYTNVHHLVNTILQK